VAELVVLTVGVLALVAAIAWHVGQQVWARRLMVRRRVVVNLVGDQAVTGVLWRRVGGFLVLRDARLIEAGADPVSMDGDVLIERDRVLFVQVAG
jgi:hypothetical protein